MRQPRPAYSESPWVGAATVYRDRCAHRRAAGARPDREEYPRAPPTPTPGTARDAPQTRSSLCGTYICSQGFFAAAGAEYPVEIRRVPAVKGCQVSPVLNGDIDHHCGETLRFPCHMPPQGEVPEAHGQSTHAVALACIKRSVAQYPRRGLCATVRNPSRHLPAVDNDTGQVAGW